MLTFKIYQLSGTSVLLPRCSFFEPRSLFYPLGMAVALELSSISPCFWSYDRPLLPYNSNSPSCDGDLGRCLSESFAKASTVDQVSLRQQSKTPRYYTYIYDICIFNECAECFYITKQLHSTLPRD